MLIFLILILICINCLIGCSIAYFKFGEVSLMTFLASFISGFAFIVFILFEKIFYIFDKLDEITIIKKKG